MLTGIDIENSDTIKEDNSFKADLLATLKLIEDLKERGENQYCSIFTPLLHCTKKSEIFILKNLKS